MITAYIRADRSVGGYHPPDPLDRRRWRRPRPTRPPPQPLAAPADASHRDARRAESRLARTTSHRAAWTSREPGARADRSRSAIDMPGLARKTVARRAPLLPQARAAPAHDRRGAWRARSAAPARGPSSSSARPAPARRSWATASAASRRSAITTSRRPPRPRAATSTRASGAIGARAGSSGSSTAGCVRVELDGDLRFCREDAHEHLPHPVPRRGRSPTRSSSTSSATAATRPPRTCTSPGCAPRTPGPASASPAATCMAPGPSSGSSPSGATSSCARATRVGWPGHGVATRRPGLREGPQLGPARYHELRYEELVRRAARRGRAHPRLPGHPRRASRATASVTAVPARRRLVRGHLAAARSTRPSWPRSRPRPGDLLRQLRLRRTDSPHRRTVSMPPSRSPWVPAPRTARERRPPLRPAHRRRGARRHEASTVLEADAGRSTRGLAARARSAAELEDAQVVVMQWNRRGWGTPRALARAPAALPPRLPGRARRHPPRHLRAPRASASAGCSRRPGACATWGASPTGSSSTPRSRSSACAASSRSSASRSSPTSSSSATLPLEPGRGASAARPRRPARRHAARASSTAARAIATRSRPCPYLPDDVVMVYAGGPVAGRSFVHDLAMREGARARPGRPIPHHGLPVRGGARDLDRRPRTSPSCPSPTSRRRGRCRPGSRPPSRCS